MELESLNPPGTLVTLRSTLKIFLTRCGLVLRRPDLLFECDLRSLAALRIAMGAFLVYETFCRFENLDNFYTDLSTLPRAALAEKWNNLVTEKLSLKRVRLSYFL